MLKITLLIIVVCFFMACLVQFIADKNEWSVSPHTYLMDLVLVSRNWCTWLGEWLGAIWSIVIIIKDNIVEFIQEFIPSIWKVAEPLLLLCWSGFYIVHGYCEYANAFIQSHTPSDFTAVWFILPFLCMFVLLLLFVWYMDKKRQRVHQD